MLLKSLRYLPNFIDARIRLQDEIDVSDSSNVLLVCYEWISLGKGRDLRFLGVEVEPTNI